MVSGDATTLAFPAISTPPSKQLVSSTLQPSAAGLLASPPSSCSSHLNPTQQACNSSIAHLGCSAPLRATMAAHFLRTPTASPVGTVAPPLARSTFQPLQTRPLGRPQAARAWWRRSPLLPLPLPPAASRSGAAQAGPSSNTSSSSSSSNDSQPEGAATPRSSHSSGK